MQVGTSTVYTKWGDNFRGKVVYKVPTDAGFLCDKPPGSSCLDQKLDWRYSLYVTKYKQYRSWDSTRCSLRFCQQHTDLHYEFTQFISARKPGQLCHQWVVNIGQTNSSGERFSFSTKSNLTSDSWVKWSGREDDHWGPSNVEVYVRSWTSISVYVFKAGSLIKHRDFALSLRFLLQDSSPTCRRQKDLNVSVICNNWTT